MVGAAVVAWQVYPYRHQTNTMTAWAELGGVPGNDLQFFLPPEQAAESARRP